ncbi:MAG: PH domain-containing protein [Planctomycetota bacterium]|jgi:hypothetical protein
MDYSGGVTLEIDTDSVARLYYVCRGWFFLRKTGREYALRQAQALRYTLTDDALFMERGLWWRSRTMIPLAKIASVVVNRNPLYTRFGLALVFVRSQEAWSGRPHHLLGLRDPEGTVELLRARMQHARTGS